MDKEKKSGIKLTLINRHAYLERFEAQIAQWTEEIEIKEQMVEILREHVFEMRERDNG